MLRLALRSLRFRTGSFLASFLTLFFGALIVTAFASMLDTAGGEGVSKTSEETLTIVASVVGGWGLLLVAFAAVSTMSLQVRQRGEETALLKSVGATPAQLGRMITGEAAVLSLVAGLLAIVPAMLAGRGLLELLISTEQVDASVDYRFGVVGLSVGLGVTFVSATVAAAVTVRRTVRMRVAESRADAANDGAGMGRGRKIAGSFFLAVTVSQVVMTVTMMKGKGGDAQQTAGTASVTCAIGLALFAPVLVRAVVAVVGGTLERLAGVSGYLTAQHLRQRTNQAASALVPVILFTGIALGTLYMQSIENDALKASGVLKSAEEKNIETLNFVVVGMIVLFAAIMLVNTLVAAMTHRNREFGQQRLAGATPRQVLRAVVLEGVVLAVAGVVAGTVAGLATVLPYSYARTGSFSPEVGPAIFAGTAVAAVALTLLAGAGTVRRALRTPAVTAAGV